MSWNASYTRPPMFQLAIISGIALLFLALISSLKPLYFVGFLLILVVLLPKWYMKHISENLILKNDKQRVKLFINDEGFISFELVNQSRFPVFSGTFYFLLDDYIECTETAKTFGYYQFEFTMNPRSKAVFKVPIKGKSRGLAKIKQISMDINDPFKIQKLRLDFNELYKKDFIIYPSQSVVNGIHNIQTNEEGYIPKSYSLFHDMTRVTGTRDYLSGDPFKNIHWKATARMGELQTKTFERTIGMTWSIVLMFKTSIHDLDRREDVDKQISRAAYICQFAQKRHINVEIFTNIKPPGADKIFYIPANHTMSHHAKLMELLAMVQSNQVKTKQNVTLSEMDKRLMSPRQLFIMQPLNHDADANYFIQKWQKKGHRMFEIIEADTYTFIKPLVKEGA